MVLTLAMSGAAAAAPGAKAGASLAEIRAGDGEVP